MKRLTVFFASPRNGGNSDALAQHFVAGARAAGHIVNEVVIRDLNINGCCGCEYCYTHQGECAQHDDMQEIYNLLAQTDIIVFATPIYYQAFPAQLKSVVDRLYVTENRTFPITGAVLLATYATQGDEMAKQTKSYFECLVEYHDWENRGIITVDGLDEKKDIEGNPALMKAYELGFNL